MQHNQGLLDSEPRWPALLALLAVGGLYSALPSSLLVGGPRWLLMVLVLALLVPTMISRFSPVTGIASKPCDRIAPIILTIAFPSADSGKLMSSRKNGDWPQAVLTSSAILEGEFFFVITSSRRGVT